MLTVAQLLEPLSRHRTDEVVVTTMSVVRPWGLLSDSDPESQVGGVPHRAVC